MKIFAKILAYLLKKTPPETAHKITIKILENHHQFIKNNRQATPKSLQNQIFGLNFSNPIGLAAGFDKNAQALIATQKLGFGFTEIGTVTPKSQKGNPKPRIFRIKENNAIINQLGFNNHGMEIVAQRIKKTQKYISKNIFLQKNFNFPIGINIGPNKDTSDKIEDYLKIINYLMPLTDYCCINISSPNTPKLREFHEHHKLEELLKKICSFKQKLAKHHQKPILVKISPDLEYPQLKQVANLIKQYHINGVIISNTTVKRDGLISGISGISGEQIKKGGLSGPPLFKLSTYQLARFYLLTKGEIPLIGTGGIHTPKTAIEKIKAGASLIQIYTSLAYQGPSIIKTILNSIEKELKQNNLDNIKQIIGIKAEQYVQKYQKEFQVEETG